MNYFIFTLDEKYYAVPLSAIEKVIRAVELISVPKAPDNLLGLLNIKGKIIPVINIRKKLHLPDREMELNDRIVISYISGQLSAFAVNGVEGVADSSFKLNSHSGRSLDQAENVHHINHEIEEYIEGIGKLNHKTVIIYKAEILL